MKDKERYKLIYNDEELGEAIIDTEEDLSDDIHGWNILCDLLNQQDKRIKELEDVLEKYEIENAEELDGVLKPLIDNGELENWRKVIFWKAQNERLKQERAELKQTQKQLAISELEKVREKFGYKHNTQLVVSSKYLRDFIDNQIKELKGEKC